VPLDNIVDTTLMHAPIHIESKDLRAYKLDWKHICQQSIHILFDYVLMFCVTQYIALVHQANV